MAATANIVVDTTQPLDTRPTEIATPTTPRPIAAPQMSMPDSSLFASRSGHASEAMSSSSLSQHPSESTLSSTVGSQFDASHQSVSQTTVPSNATEDVDMDSPGADTDMSDNETEAGEGQRSTRKKKGQRFFCTDYPPCNLSFTRSEHLARHIRKHTGERPFQCHCNRRFSRLDNLRQHAQTVHVNEEIPGDSLAATGTRFQRQIRTERARPVGRPRSGTMGSTGSHGSHGRGHTRNLSNSSITSTSSNYSNTTETRRRPPPLLMAGDGSSRPKLGLDRPQTPPAQYRGYPNESPSGFGTPSSSTYSAVTGSPAFGSSVASPLSNASRSSGGFFGARVPGRRLSVPSGANPYQSPYANSYPMPHMVSDGSSHTSVSSSMYASPTASTFSYVPSYSVAPGEDWRRKTWHPSTIPAGGLNYARPATSGLTFSQTPDAPQPTSAQHTAAAAGNGFRLPGIDSFYQMQRNPSTPPRRQGSPVHTDPPLQQPVFATPALPVQHQLGNHEQRRSHVSWDVSRDNHSSWGQQTITDMQDATRQPHISHLPASSAVPPVGYQQPQRIAQEALQMESTAPGQNKRHGWYNGPATALRTSPEDSSSSEGVKTPGTSAAEVNPAIMTSSGFIESHHHVVHPVDSQSNCVPTQSHGPAYQVPSEGSQQASYYNEQRGGSNDMGRLEALVAVATAKTT